MTPKKRIKEFNDGYKVGQEDYEQKVKKSIKKCLQYTADKDVSFEGYSLIQKAYQLLEIDLFGDKESKKQTR